MLCNAWRREQLRIAFHDSSIPIVVVDDVTIVRWWDEVFASSQQVESESFTYWYIYAVTDLLFDLIHSELC